MDERNFRTIEGERMAVIVARVLMLREYYTAVLAIGDEWHMICVEGILQGFSTPSLPNTSTVCVRSPEIRTLTRFPALRNKANMFTPISMITGV